MIRAANIGCGPGGCGCGGGGLGASSSSSASAGPIVNAAGATTSGGLLTDFTNWITAPLSAPTDPSAMADPTPADMAANSANVIGAPIQALQPALDLNSLLPFWTSAPAAAPASNVIPGGTVAPAPSSKTALWIIGGGLAALGLVAISAASR